MKRTKITAFAYEVKTYSGETLFGVVLEKDLVIPNVDSLFAFICRNIRRQPGNQHKKIKEITQFSSKTITY